MGTLEMAWAWNVRTGSASMKAVLLVLADCSWPNGESAPGIEALCARTELDRKTIFAAITALNKAGLIADSGKRTGQNNRTTVWTLQTKWSSSTKSGTIMGMESPSSSPPIPPSSLSPYMEDGFVENIPSGRHRGLTAKPRLDSLESMIDKPKSAPQVRVDEALALARSISEEKVRKDLEAVDAFFDQQAELEGLPRKGA